MDPSVVAALEPRFYPTASVHQENVEKHFGQALLRELGEDELQLLQGLDLYFVVFTNRSGSTYLTEIMHQMGAGVHPRAEFFNYDMVVTACEREGFRTFTDYLLHVIRDNHRNALIGFKISIHQLFWATRLGLLQPFRSVKLIESVRADVLGQAVSHYKARATGKWHSLMPGGSDAPVAYAREEILKSLFAISNRTGLLNYYCAIHGLPRLEVVYETLLAQPRAEISRLAGYLGMRDFDPAAVDMGAIGIQQQRNEENERLRAAFINEFYMSPGSADDRPKRQTPTS
jgi:LPS sulfotransferase NodH